MESLHRGMLVLLFLDLEVDEGINNFYFHPNLFHLTDDVKSLHKRSVRGFCVTYIEWAGKLQ